MELPPRGFEPLSDSAQSVTGQDVAHPGKTCLPNSLPNPAHLDPDLAAVVTAWPSLPEPVREAIARLAQLTGGAS